MSKDGGKASNFDTNATSIYYIENKIDRPCNSPYEKILKTINNLRIGAYDGESPSAVLSINKAAATEFVEQKGNIDSLPYFAERLNKPLIRVPTSQNLMIPPTMREVLSGCDQNADQVVVPFAPSIEHLRDIPQNLYSPKTTLDYRVLNNLEIIGIYQLLQVSTRSTLAYTRAFEEAGWDDTKTAYLMHATWADRTKIDLVDVRRSKNHQERMTRLMQPNQNNIGEQLGSTLEQRDLVLPDRGSLERMLKLLNNDFDKLRGELSRKIDDPTKIIVDYDERAIELLDGYLGILDACRWHIEHGSMGDNAEEKILFFDTLNQAYEKVDVSLQIFNSQDDDGLRFSTFHDISTLIAGVKVDTPHGGGGKGDRAVIRGYADYLDAFMAVANYTTASEYVAAINHVRGRNNWTPIPEIRSIFGDFRTSHDTIRQQLVMMSVLYFRMPKWQQRKYEPLILKQFDTLDKKLREHPRISSPEVAHDPHPLLLVPSVSHRKANVKEVDCWNFNDQGDLAEAQYVMPVIDWMYLLNKPGSHRYDGLMQVFSPNIVTNTPKNVIGYGSTGAYFDEWGYIHPGKEKHPIIPKVRLEINPNMQTDDNLYEALLKKFTDINLTPNLKQEEPFVAKRKEVLKFLRTHKHKISQLEWSRERIAGIDMDAVISVSTELPLEFRDVAHSCERAANIAIIPYLPSIEYLEHSLTTSQTDPKSDQDKRVIGMMQDLAPDLIEQATQNNHSFQSLVSIATNQTELAQLLKTWAESSAYEGVEPARSITHQDQIMNMIHTGQIIPPLRNEYSSDIDKSRFEIPTIENTFTANSKAADLLQELNQELHQKIIDDSFVIERYQARVDQLFGAYSNIIDVCRWHMEHGSSEYTSNRHKTKFVINEAYHNLGSMIQIFANNDDFNKTRLIAHHDISTLIAGSKVSKISGIENEDLVAPCHTMDYLDAFMVVSSTSEVVDSYKKIIEVNGELRWSSNEGERAIFGDFRSASTTLKQQQVLMGILYFRMPEWQREIYSDVINQKFENIRKRQQDKYSTKEPEDREPLLYIPSMSNVQEPPPYLAVYDFIDPAVLPKMQRIEHFIYPLVHLSVKNKRRHDGKIQIFVGDAGMATGLDPDLFYVDSWGYLHPKSEPYPEIMMENPGQFETAIPQTNDLEMIEKAEKSQPSWLEIMSERETLLPEARMTAEAAANIELLLERDIETGSFDAVADFAAALERLLGRKPTKEQEDFISLLMELSFINKNNAVFELEHEKVAEALEKLRSKEANLGDLDQGSALIMMMAITGKVPRELLIELIFKTYGSLGSILTLEAITAFEKLDNERLIVTTGLKEPQHVILDGRKTLQSHIENGKKNDPDYKYQEDKEYYEKAIGIVKKITKLLFINKEYDATMKSALIAVLAAKEKGKVTARCNVDGILLQSILSYVCPELGSYYAETSGPEGLLSIPEFVASLEKAKDSGSSTHAFTEAPIINTRYSSATLDADATSGKIHLIASDHRSVRTGKNMQMGVVTKEDEHKLFGIKREVFEFCKDGGDPVMAALARDAHQIEYALLANPDWPLLHLGLLNDPSIPNERRAESLDLVLRLEPTLLAFATKYDFAKAAAATRLRNAIELGQKTNRWGGALFAANILKTAGYFPKEIKKEGVSLHTLLTKELAMIPIEQFDQIIETQGEFILPEDIEEINLWRVRFLQEVEARKKEAEEERRASMATIVREENQAAINEQRVLVIESLEEATAHFRTEEAKEEARTQTEQPAFGATIAPQINKEIAVRATQIVKDTTDDAAEPIDQLLFADANLATQQSALRAYLTDANTPAQIQKRLTDLQGVVTQIAYNLTAKAHQKLSVGSTAITTLRDSQLELAVETLAIQLNDGIVVAAESLNIPVPLFNPKQLIAAGLEDELMLEAVSGD